MFSRRKRRVTRWGFTLTEVLAVAAIVSGMSTNSYQRAKDKAYQTDCANNLRQIGQLLTMHMLENGRYPKASFYPKDPAGGDSIKSIIRGPKQLWVCPSLPEQLQEKGLTFVYNDAISGKSSLRNPHKKWVLIEMNCASKNAVHPHPDGFNILFADGHVITSKRLPRKITRVYRKQTE